jgi:hypothetical protein
MTQGTVDILNGVGKVVLRWVSIVGVISAVSIGWSQIDINTKAIDVSCTEVKLNTEFRNGSLYRMQNIEETLTELKLDMKTLLGRKQDYSN